MNSETAQRFVWRREDVRITRSGTASGVDMTPVEWDAEDLPTIDTEHCWAKERARNPAPPPPRNASHSRPVYA